MKSKRETWFMGVQPSPRVELNTIEKLILKRHFVAENSRTTLLSYDPKTGQPNHLKTRTNILHESIHAKRLLGVTSNV